MQTATGGLGSTELRALDWKFRDHNDNIFGEVRVKTRWVKLDKIDDDDFLKTGWDDLKGDHVQSWAESKTNGWTANQVRLMSLERFMILRSYVFGILINEYESY